MTYESVFFLGDTSLDNEFALAIPLTYMYGSHNNLTSSKEVI